MTSVEAAFGKPLRLIFHVGAGKTGTSSIQETLRIHQEELKRRGFWYLGVMLEHAPEMLFPWQRRLGSEEFFGTDRAAGVEQIRQVLTRSLPAMRGAGCHTAIWSNEYFLRRSAGAIEALESLPSPEVELRVVAYVRRHAAWARSAYVQWGLKNKANGGPLRPFKDWIKPNHVEFSRFLRVWLEHFPGRCVVRNYDAAGDVVADFMKFAGIGGEGMRAVRVNESPSPEELALFALFKEYFRGKITPRQCISMLTGKDTVRFDMSFDRILESLLPTTQDLTRVAEESAEDRAALNDMLAASGQPPLAAVSRDARPVAVDLPTITTVIARIVMHQAQKINELETRMAASTTAAEPAEVQRAAVVADRADSSQRAATAELPVFAISTGRTGSTLVQRVLNCHPDLVLWGEHHGFLNGFGQAHVQMCVPHNKTFPRTPRDNKGPAQVLPTLRDPAAALEWANPWSLEEFEARVRRFVSDYFGGRLKPGQRWGFKEIRYNNSATLGMLQALYPEGRFVFIQRDAIEVTRSKVYAFVKEAKWVGLGDEARRQRLEQMLKEVHEHYGVHETFMKRHPKPCLLVKYEELVAAPKAVITTMLSHLALDPARYDWALSEQVMASIITRTKRDESLMTLIREVAAGLVPAGARVQSVTV